MGMEDPSVRAKLLNGTWTAYQPPVPWQEVLPDPTSLLERRWGDGAERRWEERVAYEDDTLFSAPKET